MAHATIWSIIVTYRRPAQLRSMLADLENQTSPPDRTLVVDNDLGRSGFTPSQEYGVDYVHSGFNLGPAGGIALGMQWVLDRADDRDWLLLLDDDDPPPASDSIQSLVELAQLCEAEDPAIAGVGLVGSLWDHRRAYTRRPADDRLHGHLRVDLIGGGHLPLYRIGAVRAVGTFQGDLFFGFEEAEYGLRLRNAGYHLYVDGDKWRRRREDSGRSGLTRAAFRTPADVAPWRRYYTARNLTVLARRYGTLASLINAGLRYGLGGSLRLAAAGRSGAEILLPLRGVYHGLFGRLGLTIDPGDANKTA